MNLFKLKKKDTSNDWYGYCHRCGVNYTGTEDVLKARGLCLDRGHVPMDCQVCGHSRSVEMYPKISTHPKPHGARGEQGAS